MDNFKYKEFILVFSLAFVVNGCGGNSDSVTNETIPTQSSESVVSYDSSNNFYTTQSFVTTYTPNDGRLLASGCYQCHGTNGISTNEWDSIIGEDELHEEMFEKGGIMLSQAKGYTNDEITKMQEFLKNLKNSDNSEEYDNSNENDDEEGEEDDD